ncbi:uncharacterized protein GGS25DRAFT_515107 [Hypoxylon fragiforme]|uniref:uncharacterized protein n=1 Tax=Hypoxylon fragiforme TaxID=63214 RepID=UPI0020C6B74B|nr:uncharacterized protein GGS25DRAFT_515107 [Hypoxylon fragiforme]KAI2606089.1 hypothetical protein GGS25DRAFT_515107 [Hypoxylon fragiforme]
MEVTTSPTKWQLIRGLPSGKREGIRNERARRTKIAAIDFVKGQSVPTIQHINSPDGLADCLDQPAVPGASRLYVVEDLSRDVVEHLGSKLDIDPLFFREHINDYTWYNTRDPWVELPDLDIVSRTRPYFRLTYNQPRYFKNEESFRSANKQAGMFNVLRRLDVDLDHVSLFDEKSAIVALVRSKASFWIKPASEQAIGVLLIDPPITEGFSLWKGYRPFMNSPAPSEHKTYDVPPRSSLYDELLFWIQHTSQHDIDAIEDNPRAMTFRILQIICAEWLTLSRYVTARLGQIEWEIERPELFRVERGAAPRRDEYVNFNISLQKLHTWRRRLPLYRAMVADTRAKLFPEPDPGFASATAVSSRRDCVAQMARDFAVVASHIDDLLSRTERIAAVATAVTAIEESRRAIEQNTTLGRLTYLAVIFAPLSCVSSFFSMSTDVAAMGQTIWIYFCVAVPISWLVYMLVDKHWAKGIVDTFNMVKEKGYIPTGLVCIGITADGRLRRFGA